MKITEAIAVEHRAFARVFAQIDRVLPRLKSVREVSTITSVVQGFLDGHGRMETELAFVALDHTLLHAGPIEAMHQQHEELDHRLLEVHKAATCAQARRLLRAALRASRRHFLAEERTVFRILEGTLASEHLATLGRAFSRVPTGRPKRGRLNWANQPGPQG